ncbi:hypothetical protein NFI96_021198, partial [Prochilodus magdalenae]
MAAATGRYYSEGGRATKRQKTDSDDMATEGYNDPHKTLPSLVVHVRGLIDGITESDLVEALREFGTIRCNSLPGLSLCSLSTTVLHQPEDLTSLLSLGLERCLPAVNNISALFTIMSPHLSVPVSPRSLQLTGTACDFLSAGCAVHHLQQLRPRAEDRDLQEERRAGHGRISFTTSTAWFARPDSQLVTSAQRAKASLNGADIYSGCCTLKIEYAKPTRLNVFKNDQDTWDYTNPSLSGQDADSDGNWNNSQDPNANPNKRQRQPALLGDHPPEYGGPQSGYGHYDDSYGPPPPHYEGRRMGPPLGRGRGGPRYGGPQYGHGPPPEYASQADSPVIMVYGLDPYKINADRIFNVFCLYGNVERVKFMKSKPGAAMVEMGDCYAVERAISHLNHTMLFNQKLNICVSKQQAIIPGQSYQLEDSSSSFKDFHGSRNNRFTSPEQAAKNRIQRPSNVLHFFNGQPDSSTEIFNQICDELGLKPPANVKLFTGKSECHVTQQTPF